jgi:putative transcriptional regulator
MLRFRIKEMLAEKEFQERRVITLLEVARETNINRMTLSKLANHPGATTVSDNLDKLCCYFDCQISDLVLYVPDIADPANK